MAKRTLKRTRTRVKKNPPKTQPRKPTLSPAAMKKRLATRKPATGLGTAAVDALRAHRDGTPEGAPIKVSRKLRNDVRRIAKTVNHEMSDTRLRSTRTPPKPADDTEEDLFAILHQLVRAISLIKTAKNSLEHFEESWDEITTLEAAIKMLRRVDMALNDVADGRPSRIRPDKDEDEDEDEDDDDEEVNS